MTIHGTTECLEKHNINRFETYHTTTVTDAKKIFYRNNKSVFQSISQPTKNLITGVLILINFIPILVYNPLKAFFGLISCDWQVTTRCSCLWPPCHSIMVYLVPKNEQDGNNQMSILRPDNGCQDFYSKVPYTCKCDSLTSLHCLFFKVVTASAVDIQCLILSTFYLMEIILLGVSFVLQFCAM